MGISNWSATALCVYGDVTSRYSRAGELTGESVENNQNTSITNYIAKAKSDIGKRLDADLKKLHADREMDEDLKDNISDVAVFKESCVALTLAKLFEENADFEEGYDFKKMEQYYKEYYEMYQIGYQLMNYDIDESGAIEVDEKAQQSGQYRFHRT